MSIIRSGSKLAQWPEGVLAIVCEDCGRQNTHQIQNLRRMMPGSTPTDALLPILTAWCKRKPCKAELVSPDDGVADEG